MMTLKNIGYERKFMGMDIPNEDGVVFIENDGNTKIGQFKKCKITDVKEYDLIGKLMPEK